jgi:single-strand DNA-binding protein
MATFNRVFLIGNLTRDPELKATPRGTSICQFGLAVNRQFKDESGAMRDETTFLDLEAWGKQADIIGKYLTKGSSCMVEGRLKLDQWEDKQSGQKRSKIKIVVENVQFLGGKKEKQGEQREENNEPYTPPSRNTTPAPAADEEVPF